MKNIANGKIHPDNWASDTSQNELPDKDPQGEFSEVSVEDLKACWQFGSKMLDRMMFIAANTVLLGMFIADIVVPLALSKTK